MKNSTTSTESRLRLLTDETSAVGELYLFHRTDERCPADSSLWGIVDRSDAREIRLESSSIDLQRFRLHHPLPEEYRYCRLATRAELRDYVWNLAWAECLRREEAPRIRRR